MVATAHTAGASGGIFALCWGLVATLIGGLLVTDFRGFTQWWVRTSEAMRAEARRRSPWRIRERAGWTSQVGALRTFGGLFAALGLIVLVFGVVAITKGQAGSLLYHDARLSEPGAFIDAVIAAVWLVSFWRPRGGLATAWQRGGTARRALVVVSSAAALGFPLAWWLGRPMLAVVSIFICGLSVLAVISPLSRRVGASADKGSE